jgi:hypothetical protein
MFRNLNRLRIALTLGFLLAWVVTLSLVRHTLIAMANLILKEFRCVIETDEVGDDSPYFVIFLCNSGQPKFSDAKRMRDPAWDNNISSGELVQPNALVSGGVGMNTLVLVALLEEDNNPDIGSAALTSIKSWMSAAYDPFWANGTASLTQLEANLMPQFKSAVTSNLSNDDIVAFARLKVTTLAGNINLLHLHGDGGYYRVRFKTG